MFVVFFIVSLWNCDLLKYANLEGALQTAKITNREKRKRQIPYSPYYDRCITKLPLCTSFEMTGLLISLHICINHVLLKQPSTCVWQ